MRIIEQKAEEPKTVGCRIFYDLGHGTLAELLDFPKMGDPPEVVAAKQARLLGQPVETPSEEVDTPADTDSDEAPEPISDGPPPQSAPKFLTGRIPESWKK
jgi:hypothetical protein